MFIYHRHIFVSYIIQQNNPVSKSLRYIIPWFLRNRSYRRRAPSYRRHPIKLPSSVIWDKFAYRRLAANLSEILLYINEKRYESVVLVQGVPCLVFLCCKFERDRWSQRSTSKQKLLKASGRVGAILTTVASCGCPQCFVRGFHRSPVNSMHKRPVTRSFGFFFDLHLNKQFSKESWGWWLETPSCPLWRHCSVNSWRHFFVNWTPENIQLINKFNWK